MNALVLVVATIVAGAVTTPLPHARVRTVGHMEATDEGVLLRFSASELRARFSGGSLALDVEEELAVPPAGPNETDILVVTVDGARSDVVVPPGRGPLVVARGLAPGAHTLSVVKRTEPLVGVVRVRALILDDGATLLDPPPPAARRIEVISDSNAAGFGVLGKPPAAPTCGFSAATEDVTAAFPALLGKRFAADVAVVAWSGRGVYRDFAGDEGPPSVPALWQEAPAREGAPDVVVISLGGNDFATGIPNRARFFAAYHKLLDDVRARWPDAFVVLASPMPLSQRADDPAVVVGRSWMQAIVTKRGDGRMSWLVTPAKDVDGLGCLWHPGPAMQEKLAAPIADEIAKRLGW